MKFLKIAGIVFGALLLLAGIAVSLGIRWVNRNIESVINANPDRSYNISFQSADFDYLRRIISISEVTINPVGGQKGVFVDGRAAKVELNQLNLAKLFLSRELKLKELVLLNPYLVVYIPNAEENPDQDKAGDGLKGLFGDILSRGEISNFKLVQANVQMMEDGHQTGALSQLNVLATDLQTDSLKVANPIPFDYGRILVSIDSIGHRFHQGPLLRTGRVDFDTKRQQLKVIAPSLKYEEGVLEASARMEYQVDLIEFELDSLVFSGLEAASNLYSNLDVRARKLELVGLVLDDFRNKSIPRPPDEYKPMFQGLVKKLDFPLKLDTLSVVDGAIGYGESVPGKGDTWKFQLSDINGHLTQITSIPEYQALLGKGDADFTAKIDGAGDMTIAIDIPYDRDEFDLEVSLVDFPLTKVSEILKPLMNGRIETGHLSRLELRMHADSLGASNQFRFDYGDLKMEVFRKEGQNKNRLMSTITNILLKQSNLPGEKNYLVSEYFTQRNQYRGPFHLIWNSTKDGMMRIVPGNAAKEIMNFGEK